MKKNNIDWVEDLFNILDIHATKADWQQKFDEIMYSLKNEVQCMVSTLTNNEQQLIKEAQKRTTSFYINGIRSNLTSNLKVVTSEILLTNQQPELALTVLQPIDRDAPAQYFINFGRALMQVGILDQAETSFIRAAEKDPDSPEPLFHLGFQAGLNGDVASAQKFYNLSLEKDSTYIGSLLNLAYIHYQLEDFDKAIEYSKRVLKLDDAQAGGYLTICACLNATKQFNKSAQYIKQARAQFGDQLIELNEIEAVVNFELGDYQKAVDSVTRYIDKNPNAVDLFYIRSHSNLKLHNWDAALTDIEALLFLEPYDTELLTMRFNLFISAERWQEAEIAYFKLVEMAPHLRANFKDQYTKVRKNLAIFIES